MQGQQIVGYVSVKTLQMRNADLYLDYLEGLRDWYFMSKKSETILTYTQ